MFDTCPKCSYERRSSDAVPKTECPACGLQFAKYLARQEQIEKASNTVTMPRSFAAVAGIGVLGRLLAAPFYIEPRVDPLVFGARCLALAGLAVWGIYFIGLDHTVVVGGSSPIGSSFLHNVNLVFHEAGHVIFMPFGRFMAVLGGSLFQVHMPLIDAATFIYKHRNPFGGAVGLWWAGQSLMDVAPYIHDARHSRLILIGGITGADSPGAHDWKYLLAVTGKTHEAHGIATTADGLGACIVLVALTWGLYTLFRQFGNLNHRI